LQLALIGTVVGAAESIGVFLDQPTQRLIRLKTGEEHAGWVLRAVRPREVTLEKGARVEILSLPRPGAAPARRPNQEL
jgi:general secretion pathway protein N